MRYLLLGFLGVASAVFVPNDLADLKAAVDSCISEEASGLCPIFAASNVPSGQGSGSYGVIGSWDVSKVTSLDTVFYYNKRYFNQSIGDWDTASVTSLQLTFGEAGAFNQPIGDWDTSKVTTLERTFDRASVFNQPIGDWDTSKVTTLERTFDKASVFNQPVGDWDTSNVTTLKETFYRAYAFNQPIGDWDTSKVTSLSWTFYGADAFNQDLSSWVTTVGTQSTFVYSGMCPAIRGGACNCVGDMRVDGVCPAGSLYTQAELDAAVAAVTASDFNRTELETAYVDYCE